MRSKTGDISLSEESSNIRFFMMIMEGFENQLAVVGR